MTRYKTLSRRAILRIVGLAPLALTVGPGRAAAASSTVPSGEWANILRHAKTADGLTSADEAKFKLMADTLWTYFEAGVERVANGAKIEPGICTHAQVFGAAYTVGGKHTGKLIVDRRADWDANGDHPETNVCAFQCGQIAAQLAKVKYGNRITTSCYEDAWVATKGQIDSLMTRLGTTDAEGRTSSGGGC